MPIGSFDALGDLIVYSTNVKSSQRPGHTGNIIWNSGRNLSICTRHRDKTWGVCYSKGALQITPQNIDGEWIAFPVDQDYCFYPSSYSATISVSSAKIKSNIYSSSQISAVKLDLIDNIVTHTTLFLFLKS